MSNDLCTFGKHDIILDKKVDQHVHATNNPHKVTKDQIGLDKVDNVSVEEIKEDVLASIKEEIEIQTSKLNVKIENETTRAQNQEDTLLAVVETKASDTSVVHLENDETINGNKTFNNDVIIKGNLVNAKGVSIELPNYTEEDAKKVLKVSKEGNALSWEKSTETISDDIKIKSVKILCKAFQEKGAGNSWEEYTLEIITNPISENIENLIKTTNRVRLIFNGLRRRLCHPRNTNYRKPRAGRYYIRASIDDLTEKQIENFLKFRAPVITENMLCKNEKDETYIKYTLDLETLLKDKINAVNGGEDITSTMEFHQRHNQIGICPYSSAYLAQWPLTMSGKGIKKFSSDLNACISPNPTAFNKCSNIYHITGVNYEEKQLLSTPISYKDYTCIFAWKPQVIHMAKFHCLETLTSTLSTWLDMMKQTNYKCCYCSSIYDKSTGNQGGGTIGLFDQPKITSDGKAVTRYGKGRQWFNPNINEDTKDNLSGRKKRHPNAMCECNVFSFGILKDNINENVHHIWEKQYDKFACVLRTYYNETLTYMWPTNYKGPYIRDVSIRARYSLKLLPKDSYIWK